MIKKNKKKTLLGLGVGLTTASAIALPALLLSNNPGFSNLKDQGTQAYIDSAWNNTQISTLSTSPINWANNVAVYALSYEGREIKEIFDIYNYGSTNSTTNYSTSISPERTKLSLRFFQEALYRENLNNDPSTKASTLINFDASTIKIESLKTGNPIYTNLSSLSAKTSGTSAVWNIPAASDVKTTDASDRLVRILIRKPFGLDDAFAKKTYGTGPAQGLTYVTRAGATGPIGTMPELYNQPGNTIDPISQPVMSMKSETIAGTKTAIMALDLIAYLDVNNTWQLLPSLKNAQNAGAPLVTTQAINENQFNKTLSAKEALDDVINNNKKIFNLTSINAPKFWDETSTITAQYDNLSGKIKISLSLNQTIDSTRRYGNEIFSNQQLSTTDFKTAAKQNTTDGNTLISNPNKVIEFEVTGFKPVFDSSNIILIEKAGSNKNILPSAIANTQSNLLTYVNIYQNNSPNNTLPPNIQLTVSSQNDILGQAVFSLYDTTSKTVITSITIKGFKTSNVSKPVKDPIAIIDDKTFGNAPYGTASVKPYSNLFAGANNPTSLSSQALLKDIFNKQLPIRPVPVPYDNGLLTVSSNIVGSDGSFNHFLTLFSREGEIISSVPFKNSFGRVTSIVDLTYDASNNQVIVWHVEGWTLRASICLLDPNTGLLTNGQTFEITRYNSTFGEQNLASDLAIVPIPNINGTEYWIVNRVLQKNNIYSSPTNPFFDSTSPAFQFLTRVRFDARNTLPTIKHWQDFFKDRINSTLLNKNIAIEPNPGTNTAQFTAASKFKIHNISSNFINGNEYLGLDMSISFGGTTFEYGNNIHHILLKVSADPTNPLNSSPIMNNDTWNFEYVFSTMVPGFTSSRFSDVVLLSTPGSSVLTFNNPTTTQVNNINNKGWFAHGSFYSQDKTYNALTTIIQSSFNTVPSPVIISGTTQSSAAMDFSIPTGYFSNSLYNNGSYQILQQPYWQKDKIALNIRNSGFAFNDGSGTTSTNPNGTEFKEIFFDNLWESGATGNSGNAVFTSKNLGTIQTTNKGIYNGINISKNENGEDITSMLYSSTEAKLQIDGTNNVFATNAPTPLRIRTLKNNNQIWNTKTTKDLSIALDAQNNISFLDVRTLSQKFKDFIWNNNVFAEYITSLQNPSTLDLVIRGVPTWNTGNTELTVKLWFNSYYENGLIKIFTDASPVAEIKIKNILASILNVSLNNLSKITFSGDTKDIIINGENEALVGASPADNQLVKDNVDILYNFSKLDFSKWYTQEEFKRALSASTTNFFENDIKNIKIKYSPKPSSDYSVSDTSEYTVTNAQIANLIPFMHVGTYYDALVAVGKSPDGIGVIGPDTSSITNISWPFSITSEFNRMIVAGIKFQWTNDPTHANDKWVDYHFGSGAINPIDIGWNPPYLAIRIVAGNDKVTFDTAKYASPVVVTPKKIKIKLNLTVAELAKIEFSGNTKNLNISIAPMTEYPQYQNLVDLEFSVGWNFDTNQPDDTYATWFTLEGLVNRLKAEDTWMIISKGFPADFKTNFKLRARFMVKSGIPDEDRYVFNSISNSKSIEIDYASSSLTSLTPIKNYLDLNASISNATGSFKIIDTLKAGVIKFGGKDNLLNITEVTLPEQITPQLKSYLNTLGITLKYAFGTDGTVPNDSDFTTDWNTNFSTSPGKFPSATSPALYLKFFVTGTQTEIAPTNNEIIKKTGSQIIIPNFINLDTNNLTKIELSGNSFDKFNIDESTALVGATPGDTPLVIQHIEIQYNINNIALDSANTTKQWFTKAELTTLLPLYTQNIYIEDLNNIKARYSIKSSSANQGVTITPGLTEVKISAANVKSYLHVKEYYDLLTSRKVIIEGNSTNVGQIIFPWDVKDAEFTKILTKGIEFQWTINKTPASTDWKPYNFLGTTGNPIDLGFPPFLGFRIIVQSSFISTTEIDPLVNTLVDVIPSDLKILIKLSQTDLQQITFSGDTKNLAIDETKVTNLDTYKSVVDIQYSIGWDFTTNTEVTEPLKEAWYSKAEILEKLKNANTWIILKKAGFPTNFESNFKLKSRFAIKKGIANSNNYIFTPQGATSVLYTYSLTETNNIKNYVDLNAITPASIAIVKILTDGIIKFGEKDSFGRITQVILPSGITTQLQEYLTVIGVELQFAFGTTATAPQDSDFTTNWNTDLTKNPQKFLSNTPALYLRFGLTTQGINTAIIPSIATIQKSGDKLVLPQFIQLSNNNLDKITFSGSTIALVINENEALVSTELGQGPTELVKKNIEIVYNFNDKALDSNDAAKIWFTKAELDVLLPTFKGNIFVEDLNNLKAKYQVKASADPSITIDTPNLPPKVIGALTTSVLSFLHVKEYYDVLSTNGITVSGQNTSNIGNITFPFNTTSMDFNKLLANGIEFEWTVNLPDITGTTPQVWNKYNFNDPKTHPTDIGWNPPYLAFRITINSANPRTTIDNTIKNKEVDVTPKNIKIVVPLSESNLQQITFGGSTKNLVINKTGIPNFNSFSSIVDLEFSVGWNLDTNVETTPNNDIWYSETDLIAKLTTLPKSLFISRAGYPTELIDTFKLKARFVIKKGIAEEARYVFENDLNEVKYTYTETEKLTIKNYINISNLQKILETAIITFGLKDKPNSISELNIAAVSDNEKALLKILGIQLLFAFGTANPPVYTENWNDPFKGPVNPGQPLTIWLKFEVIASSSTLTEIFDPAWTHKAMEPQVEKPKFIELTEANLSKTVLTGSTIELGIDETLSLVPATGSGNTQEEVNANIEIIYNINDLKLDVSNPTKVWFTKAELATILPRNLNNIFLSDLQNVKADYRVKQASADQGWRIPTITPQLVSAANINSFIHTTLYFDILKAEHVEIQGSATNITNVIFPTDFDKDAFKILEKNGIILQWTTVKTSPADTDWNTMILDDLNTYPKSIGFNPYLGMRITTNKANVITSPAVDKVVIDVTPFNITIIYNVDSQVLAANLSPTGNTKKIDNLDETSSLAGQYPDYTNLVIQYRIGGTNPIELTPGKEWYSFAELQAQLLTYNKVILPSERQIKARYVLKEGTPIPTPNPSVKPYIGYEINYAGGVTEASLNIRNFKSFIDVTTALENLNKNATTFAPGDTTEKITGIVKTGLTPEEATLLFGKDLELRGELAITLQNPDFSTYWWQPNKNNNLPPKLPNKDTNGKPVLMWRFGLTTVNEITFDADNNTANVSTATQLNVNLPIQITIQPTDYDTIKNNIGGNTKILLLDEAINTAAIQTVKTRENILDVVPLQILYAIGGGNSPEGLPIDDNDPTKTWFTLTEFKALLAAKTTDFKTNQIRAKFFIDPNYSLGNQKYSLSTEAPETLQAEEFSATAKVKIFINKANYETLPTEITVSGSSDDLIITTPDGLKPTPTGTISPGLELVWSIAADPKLTEIEQTDNNIWTAVMPKAIDPVIRKLSVAYRVKPGYELEQSTNKVYPIDTSKIFVYIDVQNAWIDEIIFSGNLFEATIDEAPLNNKLASLPGGNVVQIQYTVDEKEWLLKDAFIAKLKQLEGALDTNNFILLKRNVKARYSIDPNKFSEFRLRIDGVPILNKPFVEDPALFKAILLSPVNVGFNGYINLSKVPNFDRNGLRITGTSINPILEFTAIGEKLKAQFAPYQDQGVSPFDIYYTIDRGTGNGNFIEDEAHKLFGAAGFKTSGFEPISSNVADQFFGIKIVARTGYQIFKNGIQQVGGWSFNIPLNIKTIKPNPFGTTKLVVKFDGYQGLGISSLWFDGATPPALASDVLNKDIDLIDQYYVEFYISNIPLTNEEINKLPQESWIRVGAPDGSGGTIKPPSNLKVGQYVIGRIRMRENSPFEIKDINLNDSVITKVVGLKVNQSEIVINPPQFRNNEYSNQINLIDGDIFISKINVEEDAKDNYLGVDLILQVRTEFYKRPNGSFITDNNGLPIVKRIPTGFFDVFGTPTGNPDTEVRIYYTDATKTIPSDPLEIGTPINLDLTEVPDSLATFIYDLNSGNQNVKQGLLFQNQTFKITVKAKPDFVLDNTGPAVLDQKITTAKYPLNLNNNTTMSLLVPDPIKYETTGELIPQNGKAFITSDTEIPIQFFENNGNISQTLKGKAAYERLVKESEGKLKIQITLRRKTTEQKFDYNGSTLDLSQLQDLSNGDRISISLVPINPNFVLIGPSSSVASWIVNELEIAAPNTDIFKDLKIVTNVNSENPIWDGQGTFFVAVKTGSGNPPEDLSDELLNPNDAVPGQTRFHFVYRVWDINKKVRVDWTPDKTRISSLKNGEKVEWRLKSQSGEPL
ncbi:MAG: hypothetical protein ACRDAW_01195, partial [Metamycoplasmataceae bacterium]